MTRDDEGIDDMKMINNQYWLPTTDCPARLKERLVGLFLLKLCLSLS